MFTSLGDGRQVPKVLHRIVSVAILLLLASMLFLESSCPIGTSNTLSRWASFWLDLGLLAAAVAKGWSPGAQEWCIALFRWGIAIACKHAFRRISYPYRIIELP